MCRHGYEAGKSETSPGGPILKSGRDQKDEALRFWRKLTCDGMHHCQFPSLRLFWHAKPASYEIEHDKGRENCSTRWSGSHFFSVKSRLTRTVLLSKSFAIHNLPAGQDGICRDVTAWSPLVTWTRLTREASPSVATDQRAHRHSRHSASPRALWSPYGYHRLAISRFRAPP